MTPTCSIGEALKPAGPATADLVAQAVRERWLFCAGPLSRLMVVSEDALREYPHGAHYIWAEGVQAWRPATKESAERYGRSDRHNYLSLDQLREAVTVKGFTACEKHRAMLEPSYTKKDIALTAITKTPHRTPPALRLTDLLRVECPECGEVVDGHYAPCRHCHNGTIPHPALTEAMEWAERLGLDREKVS